jgi:prefoldin alpha subunit
MYLIEYGAGFFVERNAKEATEFYMRKLSLIKEKLAKLQEIITDKREGLRAIEVKIYSIIQQQQQAQKK